MSPVTHSHNAYHLGDNLVHLHFLRKVALANPDRQFVHAAQWQYLSQLNDLTDDLPNLKLVSLDYALPTNSIDSWRGAGGLWYQHPNRHDFIGFHLEWFDILAKKMGVENPIKQPWQMLFDYPHLREPIQEFIGGFDILVINAPPGSGQFQAYDRGVALSVLSAALCSAGHTVITTHSIDGTGARPVFVTSELRLSVTEIGRLSLRCHTILMVSTGPSWPTFNIWNQESVKRRIILIDWERLNFSPNTVHCQTVDQAREVLVKDGLL